jgi:hypothetical protein
VTGFALLAKFTLVALFGFFVIALVIRWPHSEKFRFKTLAANAQRWIVFLLLNAAYFFASRRTEGEPALRTVAKSISVVVPSRLSSGFAASAPNQISKVTRHFCLADTARRVVVLFPWHWG